MLLMKYYDMSLNSVLKYDYFTSQIKNMIFHAVKDAIGALKKLE